VGVCGVTGATGVTSVGLAGVASIGLAGRTSVGTTGAAAVAGSTTICFVNLLSNRLGRVIGMVFNCVPPLSLDSVTVLGEGGPAWTAAEVIRKLGHGAGSHVERC
jgi:hypothetical protein